MCGGVGCSEVLGVSQVPLMGQQGGDVMTFVVRRRGLGIWGWVRAVPGAGTPGLREGQEEGGIQCIQSSPTHPALGMGLLPRAAQRVGSFSPQSLLPSAVISTAPPGPGLATCPGDTPGLPPCHPSHLGAYPQSLCGLTPPASSPSSAPTTTL